MRLGAHLDCHPPAAHIVGCDRAIHIPAEDAKCRLRIRANDRDAILFAVCHVHHDVAALREAIGCILDAHITDLEAEMLCDICGKVDIEALEAARIVHGAHGQLHVLLDADRERAFLVEGRGADLGLHLCLGRRCSLSHRLLVAAEGMLQRGDEGQSRSSCQNGTRERCNGSADRDT